MLNNNIFKEEQEDIKNVANPFCSENGASQAEGPYGGDGGTNTNSKNNDVNDKIEKLTEEIEALKEEINNLKNK